MKKNTRKIGIGYIVLVLGAIILALPFVYMASTSLKSSREAAEPAFSLFVKSPTMESYNKLFGGAGSVGLASINSMIIAICTTLGNMYLGTMAGYAFAKHPFPGRQILQLILVSTLMIPGAVLLAPGFLLYRDLGWLDTWLPLVVPGLCGSFSVFLATQFISAVPNSLIEAAQIEGSSEFTIFHRIILPVSGPLLATLGILTLLGSWNSFLGPLIILLDEKKFTLPLVIAMIQGRFPGQENMAMAGAVIATVPVLILFFIFQRQIVESLANSGLKEG